MLKDQIEKYALYNVWANKKVIDFLLAVGSDSLTKEQPSSFNSLQKTAYHIYDAEYVWLKRMKYEPWTWPPSAEFTSISFEAFCLKWKTVSNELINYVQSLSEKKLQNFCSYKNSKGEDFTTSFADCIMHCLNHSTYHRGQIITMLRSAGFTKVASTDYITFTREL